MNIVTKILPQLTCLVEKADVHQYTHISILRFYYMKPRNAEFEDSMQLSGQLPEKVVFELLSEACKPQMLAGRRREHSSDRAYLPVHVPRRTEVKKGTASGDGAQNTGVAKDWAGSNGVAGTTAHPVPPPFPENRTPVNSGSGQRPLDRSEDRP